jgi:uracil-DNA glycosylase
VTQPWFAELERFVDDERAAHTVYPPREQVFTALALTAPDDVRVVILGQDPYHGAGQAHGLAFSVPAGEKVPPSLKNIHKELRSDVDVTPPAHGSLVAWAQQGVLLLNTVLTVRDGEAHSHKGRGWERFTDDVIAAVSAKRTPVVFVLWGLPAQKKRTLVDESVHTVLTSAHPSPLSAHNGFFGSRPFSRSNAALVQAGRAPIDWRL